LIYRVFEGTETLNPWDLPPGQISPSKERIAFLNQRLLGNPRGCHPERSEGLALSEAKGSAFVLFSGRNSRCFAALSMTGAVSLAPDPAGSVTRRTIERRRAHLSVQPTDCAIRYSNPVPTFNDLREELANWRDAERLEGTIHGAKLAAIKLQLWTGEKGTYSKLFDSPTTMRFNSDWLFFDIEGLKSGPTVETAMSMVIANAVADRASGRTGQPSITVIPGQKLALQFRVEGLA
jgi:hypothetical protein